MRKVHADLKKRLRKSIVILFAGIIFIILAFYTKETAGNYLFGFGGGLLGAGLMTLWSYAYWSRPSQEEVYTEKMLLTEIEQKDELKEKLRDKSGRYAYLLSFGLSIAGLMVLMILWAFGIQLRMDVMINMLAIYMLFQAFSGILIYRVISKKYFEA